MQKPRILSAPKGTCSNLTPGEAHYGTACLGPAAGKLPLTHLRRLYNTLFLATRQTA
jgi:hypothetical protein